MKAQLIRRARDGMHRLRSLPTQRRLPDQSALFDSARNEEQYTIIVLDALRYDIASEIVPQYLSGTVRPVWSAGHDTFQYGKRVWGTDTWSTTYISGAVPMNSRQHRFEDDFFNELYDGFNPTEHLPNLIDAWESCWDASVGTVDPDALTEFALEYVDRDELLVHYFQPHAPYIGRYTILGHTDGDDAEPLTGGPVDKPIWDRVSRGETSSREIRLAYRSNLHRALKSVTRLVRRLPDDQRVILTGDHGELFGEGPFRTVSHPRTPAREIRTVPWMLVDGVRDEPGAEMADTSKSVAERLAALGYAESEEVTG